MTDCIFCKIVAGDIPAHKIYEDDVCLAFLDITQTTKGHTLLIPKQHVKHLFNMTDDLASELFGRLPRIANLLKTALAATGMNILQNNEAVAGQTVFHAHIHLIPRYDAQDTFSINFSENALDLSQLAQDIRNKAHV